MISPETASDTPCPTSIMGDPPDPCMNSFEVIQLLYELSTIQRPISLNSSVSSSIGISCDIPHQIRLDPRFPPFGRHRPAN